MKRMVSHVWLPGDNKKPFNFFELSCFILLGSPYVLQFHVLSWCFFWWWCGVVVFLCWCGGVFLWWCGVVVFFFVVVWCGGVCVVVFVWWCLCGGVCVVVFLWWWFCVFVFLWRRSCGGVFVFLWLCFCGGVFGGGVFLVVFLWLCFCGGVVVFFIVFGVVVWWCFCMIFFCQGSIFVALPRSFAKSVDNTGIKVLLTSNISFIQLSSLLSEYPASSSLKLPSRLVRALLVYLQKTYPNLSCSFTTTPREYTSALGP